MRIDESNVTREAICATDASPFSLNQEQLDRHLSVAQVARTVNDFRIL